MAESPLRDRAKWSSRWPTQSRGRFEFDHLVIGYLSIASDQDGLGLALYRSSTPLRRDIRSQSTSRAGLLHGLRCGTFSVVLVPEEWIRWVAVRMVWRSQCVDAFRWLRPSSSSQRRPQGPWSRR